MTSKELHTSAIIIDGLIVSNWSRSVFEDMKKGGITAANCTCSVWEGFESSMQNLAQWKGWFRDHDDILLQVHQSKDISRAKTENKVGIILGWQNTSGIEDRIDYLSLFRDLGVRVMQLTYNTQNFVGSGCYESKDSGLSDFGRDVIDEMNRLGILVDLSHVGSKTSYDAICYSKRPVAYTHCCPSALKDIPRNKSDEELRFIADHDGFAGVATIAPFLRPNQAATIEDFLEAIEHMINVMGEEKVGIGTDFIQDQPDTFMEWICRDKGDGRLLVDLGMPSTNRITVSGFDTIGQYPSLTAAMEGRKWTETRIRRILGENWLTFLETVWGL